MNKKLIQQLTDGKIALKNTKKHRLQLIKILKEAFPKDNFNYDFDFQGVSNYYHSNSIYNNRWCSSISNDLPKVDLTEFLKDEFVLPEKWCIRQNLSQEVCDWHRNRFIKSNAKLTGGLTYLLNTPSSYTSKTPDIHLIMSLTIREGYTEITLEQFKEHVLKQKTKIMKDRLITYEQAQQIVDIACSDWKPKLAKAWAYDIVVKDYAIKVDEEFYQKMRKACTDSQHRLFDEIFGKDDNLVHCKDLKRGQAIKVVEGFDKSGGNHSLIGYTIIKLADTYLRTDVFIEYEDSLNVKGELIPAGTEITIVAK